MSVWENTCIYSYICHYVDLFELCLVHLHPSCLSTEEEHLLPITFLFKNMERESWKEPSVL